MIRYATWRAKQRGQSMMALLKMMSAYIHDVRGMFCLRDKRAIIATCVMRGKEAPAQRASILLTFYTARIERAARRCRAPARA